MELEFEKSSVPCLTQVCRKMLEREETAEIRISAEDPAVDRVLGVWGIPIAESCVCGERSMELTGYTQVYLLYAPADGGLPCSAEGRIPIRMKWELPQARERGQMQAQLLLKSLNARVDAPRKVTVRAAVSALGRCYVPDTLETAVLRNPPSELEVLKRQLTVVLPTCTAEKAFALDEELELPGGAPACADIIACQASLRITDQKVLGEKAVFKGTCGMHLIYKSTEDRLAVWDFDLPYSQYAELPQSFEENAVLCVDPLITGVEADLPERGRVLEFRCAVTAQCTVSAPQKLEIVTDLYAPRRTAALERDQLVLSDAAESRTLHMTQEARLPAHGGNILDCTILPGVPRLERNGNRVRITQEGDCSILLYDEGGELCCEKQTAVAEAETECADGELSIDLQPSGPVQWTIGGGHVTVRAPMEAVLRERMSREIQPVKAASLSEPAEADPNRPNLIIRSAQPGQSLWDLAKAVGSSVDAVRKANHLTEEPESGCLLLLPIL